MNPGAVECFLVSFVKKNNILHRNNVNMMKVSLNIQVSI